MYVARAAGRGCDVIGYYDDREGLFLVRGTERAYLCRDRAELAAVDPEALVWEPEPARPAYVVGRFTLGVWLPAGAWLVDALEGEDP